MASLVKEQINILVVDDEENIVEFIKMGLEAEGYNVHAAFNGLDAVSLARKLNPHIIILDIMLPGMTVEQINVGQLHTRLPKDNGQLEIDKLSNSFNNMLERIETSFEKEQYIKEKMRRFVSDASHELRTPLTSIHGFVEVLLRGAAKNEKQLNLALNSILLESERLTKLVNDLLMLTKLDLL